MLMVGDAPDDLPSPSLSRKPLTGGLAGGDGAEVPSDVWTFLVALGRPLGFWFFFDLNRNDIVVDGRE